MGQFENGGALNGIRVLDLSRVLAGPFCTQILGDLGADILKIEKPHAGDDTRFWGPPYLQDDGGQDTRESAYYLSANRNKRSVAIDIKTEDGQELIHKLLAQSDVLIENFKTGGLDKYGLGYEQVKERHPHIIYTSITGFGQSGPRAQEAGYDFLAQGMSGMMACTGEPEGEPMKIGVALSDVMTGLYAAIGTLAALQAREKTGKGQLVDLALLDCTISSLTNIAQYYLTSGKIAPRVGNAHSTIVPYQNFESADGHIIIAVGNDNQFQRFCAALGRDELAQDEAYATNSARVQHREQLVPVLAEEMKKRSTEEWLNILHENRVPCGPVNTMDQVFDMEQVQAREMEIGMEHPLRSEAISLVGSPLKLSDTPPAYHHAPPVLGQHTREVLEQVLGLDSEEIDALAQKNSIQTR